METAVSLNLHAAGLYTQLNCVVTLRRSAARDARAYFSFLWWPCVSSASLRARRGARCVVSRPRGARGGPRWVTRDKDVVYVNGVHGGFSRNRSLTTTGKLYRIPRYEPRAAQRDGGRARRGPRGGPAGAGARIRNDISNFVCTLPLRRAAYRAPRRDKTAYGRVTDAQRDGTREKQIRRIRLRDRRVYVDAPTGPRPGPPTDRRARPPCSAVSVSGLECGAVGS